MGRTPALELPALRTKEVIPMTDKTCSTCIWYDPYLEQKYGFCHEKQMWVDGKNTCEVYSDGRQTEKAHGHCSGTET